MNDVAYKILFADEFADLQAGNFDGAPIDIADGYIHLSTALQLPATVEKHFAGRTDLIIAAIDLKALGKKIRWEMSRGDALFPHLYAELPIKSAVGVHDLPLGADGRHVFPPMA